MQMTGIQAQSALASSEHNSSSDEHILCHLYRRTLQNKGLKLKTKWVGVKLPDTEQERDVGTSDHVGVSASRDVPS